MSTPTAQPSGLRLATYYIFVAVMSIMVVSIYFNANDANSSKHHGQTTTRTTLNSTKDIVGSGQRIVDGCFAYNGTAFVECK